MSPPKVCDECADNRAHTPPHSDALNQNKKPLGIPLRSRRAMPDDGHAMTELRPTTHRGPLSVLRAAVFALVGTSLRVSAHHLLLFSIARSGVGTVANSELVAEEIVRTLVGSIGLVASVPVTTALAALVAPADRPGPQTESATPGAVAAGGAAAGRGGRRRKR